VLASHVTGDGADVLVHAWATRHDDGTVDVLLWNGTINGELMAGDPRLDRHVRLAVAGLDQEQYQVALARVDERHSNIVAECPTDVDWPDAALWSHLWDRDRLHQEPLPDVTPEHGVARFDLDLPMPGVARIRLAVASSTKEENVQ
jgi:xylan 1,4-beta-xylosidase